MNIRHTALGLCLGLFLFASCDKEDQTIGIDMLSPSDLLTTRQDSTSTGITMKTVLDDSVRSTKITYMVGENYDNALGKTRAGVATRLYLQAMAGDISGYKLDSVCFSLAKSSTYYYGDTTVAQTFSLYELNQAITVDECEQYEQYGTMPSCIASKTKIRDIAFAAYQDDNTAYSYKLDATYASNLYSRLKECYATDASIQYVDSLFLKKYHGIYLTTKNDAFNNVKSVIAHCVPGITFYLSSQDTTITLKLAPSPQAYDSPLSTDPSQIYLQAINVFQHDYSTTSVSLGTTSTTSYVQGFLGVKTQLSFSGLDTWRDSAMAINYAKLYIPIESRDTWSEYLPINFRVYDAKRNLIYSTMSIEGKDSTNFVFNIHNFLLHFYNNTATADEYTYELSIAENNTYGNAFVLKNIADKMKLVITYTKTTCVE